MIALLKEYRDCFAWDYTEMPGLDRSIVEHRLPLKKGFRPFQQRARQMKAEVLEEVKKEVEKMLDAGFIRPCRYAEWISSMVLVQKKDGRWHGLMNPASNIFSTSFFTSSRTSAFLERELMLYDASV